MSQQIVINCNRYTAGTIFYSFMQAYPPIVRRKILQGMRRQHIGGVAKQDHGSPLFIAQVPAKRRRPDR